MEEILKKISTLNKHFRSTSTQSDEVRFLQRMVKLSEEVGELSEAALCEVDPNQRKKDRPIDFDAELADVIITALMLSTGRVKDIINEIDAKLDIVMNRLNINPQTDQEKV
ncbi:MAG: hypothetical protein AUK16_03350 [Parcubacteria group bacterium CG2_30_44_11]|nr:MAG: hypothetical protein AUK16_03350 [Parcubacteria group bacterium CG2_30_44_11]